MTRSLVEDLSQEDILAILRAMGGRATMDDLEEAALAVAVADVAARAPRVDFNGGISKSAARELLRTIRAGRVRLEVERPEGEPIRVFVVYETGRRVDLDATVYSLRDETPWR
jgi:hypothetical protein